MSFTSNFKTEKNLTKLKKEEHGKTHLLLSRFYFDDLSTKDCIKWAKDLYAKNYYSKSLLKIVKRRGTKQKTYHKYFLNALRELEFPIINDKEKSCRIYSSYIIDLYREDKIEATVAIQNFLKILPVVKNKEKYLRFFHLAEEFSLIDYDLSSNELNLKRRKTIDEKFKTVLIQFQLQNGNQKYWRRLDRKSDKALVRIKYFKRNKKSRLELAIVDEILSNRGLSKKEIEKLRIKVANQWFQSWV